jgi:hypothetical protein
MYYPIGRSTGLVLTSDGEWFIQYVPEEGPRSSSPVDGEMTEDGWWESRNGAAPGPERNFLLHINDRGYSLSLTASPRRERYAPASHEGVLMIIYR